MNRRRGGFTLIELMVVVAIVAIMLVLAAPSFVSFISKYRVTSATNDFLQGVTLTRGEALKRGHKVLMVPNQADGTPSVSGNWTNGWTIFVDNNGDQTYNVCAPPSATCVPDEMIFQHAALPPSIRTSGFSPAGLAVANAFVDGAKTYIQFDGTGFPRLIPPGTLLSGGIVLSDVTGAQATLNTRTLCVGRMGRAKIVQGADPDGCKTF